MQIRATRLVSTALLIMAGLFVAGANAAPAAAAPAPTDSVTLDAKARKEVLTELAKRLEADYVMPDTAQKLAAMVRAKQKANAYKGIPSSELASVLTTDLRAIAPDKHLRVIYIAPPPLTDPMSPPTPEMLRAMNGMVRTVQVLDGNVGYMRVDGVPPLEVSREPIAAAFAFLHRTDALIIDTRGNGGGDASTVALYMSYLSEGQPYVVNTFHWREGNRVEEFSTSDLGELSYGARKPVYVLCSAATFSGGEEIAYDIQAFKRGTIVGEVTGGGAHPGGPARLGHGFVAIVPRGQAVSPVTKSNWEGVGVKPEVPVPAAEALDKAHALALERLIADATDPRAKASLEKAAAKLSTNPAAEPTK